MKKKITYYTTDGSQSDERIAQTLSREFQLPQVVADAQKRAFHEIRIRSGRETEKRLFGKRRALGKACGWAAAFAAVFSIACISNPALAENIPLIGHVFEKIGRSLTFSGNYGDYSQVVEPEPVDMTQADTAAQEAADTICSQTANGVTVTLSEIYCNDISMNVGVVIESEEAFAQLAKDQNGNSCLYLHDAVLEVSYYPEDRLLPFQLEGRLLDDHTFAGMLRTELTFTDEQGVLDTSRKAPHTFSARLTIPQIVGDLAEPALPPASEDAGQSSEVGQFPNRYENWWVDGDWDFTFDVTVNEKDSQTLQLNETDGNGFGLKDVTKTPVEVVLSMETPGEAADYIPVVLDAQGEPLRMDSTNSLDWNIFAIGGCDASKVDVYICGADEWFEELKGYYWSDDYEEKKKTKTYKELLDERALYHKEIVFEG